MSKLQQLLDKKWPLNGVHSDTDKSTLEMFRRIFTEGYNAAKEEAKAGLVSDEDLRLFHARMQENILSPNGPLKNE